MENLTLPLITLISPLVGWLIWLTIKTFQNDKSIAVNTSNDAAVNKQIQEVKIDMEKKIDKFENHVNRQFDQVGDKFERVFEMLNSRSGA
jgi:hypothetical protein